MVSLAATLMSEEQESVGSRAPMACELQRPLPSLPQRDRCGTYPSPACSMTSSLASLRSVSEGERRRVRLSIASPKRVSVAADFYFCLFTQYFQIEEQHI